MPKINPVLNSRYLTNWQQDCVSEQNYMNKLKVGNSRDYKTALMNNGNSLIREQTNTIFQRLADLSYGPKW